MKHPGKILEIPYLTELDGNPGVDGILSLLDKFGTRKSISCVNWKKDFPYQPLTTFSIAHSKTKLFIDFFTRCNYLRAENYSDQSPVSEDSCVEVFIMPRPETREYWNFEFNCIGAINASRRVERPHPTRLSSGELASIKRFASCGSRPFRELEGLFNWNLLVEIPFELMGVVYEGHPIEMLANFYKCASKATQPHYLSWSPIESEKPDFHRPEFFSKIIIK